MFCCTLLYVLSSIAIILMGKRELVALLNLSSWCLVVVEGLFLVVPWGCLRFVIVVFPDHTHLLFWFKIRILARCHYLNIHKSFLGFSVLSFWQKVGSSLSENMQFSIRWDSSKYRAGMNRLHTRLKIGLSSLNIH